MDQNSEVILSVEHLKTYFLSGRHNETEMRASDDLSYQVHKGEFVAATTLEEQIEAAKVVDQSYMSGHYLLLVSYGQQWTCYYNNRVHGLHGELTTKNYWAGFMFARTWVSE